MLHFNKYLFLIFCFFFFTKAIALESDWSIQNESQLRLISPLTSSNNQTEVFLGLEYKLKDGWKTYWKSPGDGGFPQEINWTKSKNIKSLDLYWPKPKKFEILGMKSLGYENNVIFPIKIILANASKDTLINLDVNYLICKDICIPGKASLELILPPGIGELTSNTFTIEKALSEIPIESKDLSFINNINAEIYKEEDRLSIVITAEAKNIFKNPSIFLHTDLGLPVVDPIISMSSDSKFFEATYIFQSDLFNTENVKSQFLISDQKRSYIFKDTIKIKKNINKSNKILFFTIFFALIGGLILNAMPCVLPVLSIKVLSLLNHIENPLLIRKSFLVTSLGIISSFVLLSLSFIFLRYLGINVGWGMQFQQPFFLMVICIILVFFAFNLFGLFEINLPSFISDRFFNKSQNSSLVGDFLNGFFATLMATPCSAPFVGTAITFAFTQSMFMMFLIFLFMGFGMSLPYLLVSILPQTLYFFPKPGKWMVYLKYLMGFLLLATLLWIVSILLNHFNLYFIVASIFLLLITLLLNHFIFFKKTIILISIFIFFTISNFSFFNSYYTVRESDWMDFNSVDIKSLIDDNKIIFVDITADWCATCQYNKINVLNSTKTEEIFSKYTILKVRGDWTKPNDKIYEFLKANNKFGIPFNIIYNQKYPKGIILNELFTYNEIEQALKKLNNN